jgi:hypothetical protein
MKLPGHYSPDIESDIDPRSESRDTRSEKELRRLLENVLRAVEPLERQMIPIAHVRPVRPDVRAIADGAVQISNWQSSPPLSPPSFSPSSKWVLISMRVAIVVAAGVAVGSANIAAGPVRFALTESPVTHSPARLAESETESGVEDAAPAAISQARQIPIAPSAPIVPSAPTSGPAASETPVARLPASSQTQVTSSSVVQASELAQRAAVTAESGAPDTLRERDYAAAQIDRSAMVLADAQPKASPRASESQTDGSEQLFRKFLEWQSSKAKPEVQRPRFSHSSKRVARAQALRSHRTIVPNAANKRTSSSSRARNDRGHPGPSDAKDSNQRS